VISDRYGKLMLYPHLQPECDYVKRYLIRAHDTAPHEHEGLTPLFCSAQPHRPQSAASPIRRHGSNLNVLVFHTGPCRVYRRFGAGRNTASRRGMGAGAAVTA